jgi:hypothetical protein
MNPTKKPLWALALGAAVLATGCSDAVSTGDPLPEADAEELSAALIELGFADPSGAFHRTNPDLPPGIAMAPSANFTYTVNQTRSCHGSGTVALAGKIEASSNDAGTEGSLDFDYTFIPSGCEVTTRSQKQYTVAGDPHIKVSGGLDAAETSTGATLDGTLKYEGGFTWEGEDGSGGCKFDISAAYAFESTESSFSGEVTVSGEVCGISVNHTESIEVSS